MPPSAVTHIDVSTDGRIEASLDESSAIHCPDASSRAAGGGAAFRRTLRQWGRPAMSCHVRLVELIVCVTVCTDDNIDVSTDGRCDVRIGGDSFRATAYGISSVRVAGGITVNISTYDHDYGATNTRLARTTDTSANAGPECSRDVSADDNSHVSTARASTSVVVHGGTNVGTHVGIYGSIHDGLHSGIHVSTHDCIHGGTYGLCSRAHVRTDASFDDRVDLSIVGTDGGIDDEIDAFRHTLGYWGRHATPYHVRHVDTYVCATARLDPNSDVSTDDRIHASRDEPSAMHCPDASSRALGGGAAFRRTFR